ncbi:MAG TPA: RDD family protein [Lacunisphaera sp.]|nr:RDD family protein [Lacunisphaera sp.]
MFTILGADGKEYGPVTAGKVIEWMQAGRANAQTKIKRVDATEWTTIGALPEFGGSDGNQAAMPPTPPPPAASAGAGLLLASRWLRLGAQILDGLISCVVALPGFCLLLMAGVFSHPDQPNPALMFGGFGLLGLALVGLLIFQIYLLTTRGQTIGKKLLGIRIVSFDDESNPGFVKAFLLRVFVNGLISAVPVLGGIYSLVDICFIFRDDKRCIHDLIAGTKVVTA